MRLRYIFICAGLILTYAIPVYNSTNRGLSTLYGAAAIDVSMTALFDDVIHFKWRRNSYSFIVERERGLVLVHPKLDIPSHQTHTDPVFSTMEFVEPTLTAEQRGRILAANTSVSSFEAEASSLVLRPIYDVFAFLVSLLMNVLT